MSGKNNSPKKQKPIPRGVIIALISFSGVIITAICGFSSSIGSTIIEILANANKSEAPQKSQVPSPTWTTTATLPSPSPVPTSTSILITPSASKSQCPEVDIYFRLNLSTGVDQVKCPNEQNVIDLTDTETQGLGALSGQAISSAFTNETTCRWKWSTNENVTWQEFQSPKGVCSFSTGLTQTTKKVFLQLISDPSQPFFTINLQR